MEWRKTPLSFRVSKLATVQCSGHSAEVLQPSPRPPRRSRWGNGPNILQAAQRDAYVAFKAKFPNQPKETIDSAWKESLAAYFQGQPSGSLGAMHFKQFAADGFVRPEAQSPIEENAAFDPEEIPF